MFANKDEIEKLF